MQERITYRLGARYERLRNWLNASVARDDERERAAILAAYERSGGNKSRLAALLGVSRKTLYARLKRLDLTLP